MESHTGSRVSRTLNVFCCAVALLAPFATPTPGRAASPAAKIPLDYPAYDTYAFVRGTTISDDGRYAAYVLAPEDGDPTLVIHDFSGGADLREPRGTAPRFTADSHTLVYTLRAPNDDIRKATLANKKPSEFPPNGLGIVDLATGKNTTIELVKSVAVPRDTGSTTIAYARATPTPVPSGREAERDSGRIARTKCTGNALRLSIARAEPVGHLVARRPSQEGRRQRSRHSRSRLGARGYDRARRWVRDLARRRVRRVRDAK